LSTPATILLVVLGLLALVSGYLIYRRSEFGESQETVVYK
jgi:hypothetical protein